MFLKFKEYAHQRKFTLFGRALTLLVLEVIANAVCWAVAGLLFARGSDTQSILGLALLAWACL
jgi:nickel/cobalt transporter (NiCoT) family protein